MRKRLYGLRLASLFAAVMALAVVAAASASAKSKRSSGKNVTLKVVVANYGTGTSKADQNSLYFWQSVAAQVHKQYPNIKADITSVNWTDFDKQVQTMVENHNIPDITEGDYFSAYAQEHLLYSSSQVLPGSVNHSILPAFRAQGTYKGKLYGLPWTTSTRALFTNTAILKKAGIKSPPKTWAQLKADGVAISKKTGKIGFGLALGPEEPQAEALQFFLGDGGNYTKGGKGKVWTINSPANIKAFNFMESLVKAGATEPDPASVDRTAGIWAKFEHGQVGMTFGQNALVGDIKSAHGISMKNLKVTALPGEHGALKSTLGVCDNVSAFKAHGNETAIKDFLSVAYSIKNQLAWSDEYGFGPPTTTGAKAVTNPYIKGLDAGQPHAVQYPSANPGWGLIASQLKATLGTALNNPAGVLGTLQQAAVKASASSGS